MRNSASFICINCGNQTAKWVGCCPSCKTWDSIQEETPSRTFTRREQGRGLAVPLKSIEEISYQPAQRMVSHIKEWDRVTGGGIVPGEFVILTGDPGIGKSTLLLQIAHQLSEYYNVIYFSSEESLEQVAMRARRLACKGKNLLFSDQANLDDIVATVQEKKPAIVIIDSIQNCFTSDMQMIPGSIGQLKEAGFRLMRLAKDHGIAIIMSGHITKEGHMAGPKMLEHMVDAVLYLQGEDRWQTRVLRAVKNRFGTVNELGFFQMHEQGLQEVPNINQQLLAEASHSPGSILTSFIEGSRALLIELQALTVPSKFGMPQRIISGIDQTQVALIAAILEKYLQIKFSAHDIFFKISGAFKVKESSLDLAIALALLSSYFQQPLPEKCVALGEISLTGRIKPINHIGLYLGEAEQFGITQLLVARNQKIETSSCHVTHFHNAYELLALFGE
jgi:DNA repair protein RadA/Sms